MSQATRLAPHAMHLAAISLSGGPFSGTSFGYSRRLERLQRDRPEGRTLVVRVPVRSTQTGGHAQRRFRLKMKTKVLTIKQDDGSP